MPIHDQGYRRYGGVRTPAGRAWSVIAKAGIRTLISKRAFIGLLLLSWVPLLVRAVQIYAATNLPQASFLTWSGDVVLTPEAPTAALWSR